MGIFLWHWLWRPGGAPSDKIHQSVERAPCLDFPGTFNFQACLYQASSKSSMLTVQIFLPWHSFPERFLFMGFCSSKRWFSVPTCMSLQFLRAQTRSTVYILSSYHLYRSSIISPLLQWRNKLRKFELYLKSEAKPGLESRLSQLQSLFFEPPYWMATLISKLISKSPGLEPE